MTAARAPADEAERLRALRSVAILDTPAEAGFDLIATAAARIAGTEIGLVSLVDAERQWFKAKHGLDLVETHRDVAFCAHAILDEEGLVVDDATRDPRFFDNPHVTAPDGVRSYAGAPIVVDGRRIGTVCAVGRAPRSHPEDVIDQLKMLAALTSERLEFSRRMAIASGVLSDTSDAVVAVDETLTIVLWNPAAEALFGHSVADAVGRPLTTMIAPAAREALEALLAHARSGGAALADGRCVPSVAVDRNGCEIPVELSISAARSGARLWTSLVIRNRREHIARERERLSRLAHERFLANMSHELRTPLNGILGLADALDRTALTPQQRDLLSDIQGSATTLEGVLCDIFDTVSMQASEIGVSWQAFDLARLMATVPAVHRRAAEAKGVELVVAGPTTPTWITGDPTRLAQILGKLLGNAVKFTETGRIDLTAQQTDGCWTFEVADTGPGLSDAARRHLFSAFHLGDASLTKRHAGVGLGLSVARGLARALGGDLTLRDHAQPGTALLLKLPMPEALVASAASDPDHPVQPVAAEGPVRILLAEDNPTNRRVVELILAELDVELTAVENGAEALACYQTQPFDVVLMDIQMPVMDGLSAVRAIRAFERERRRPRCPILMLTANTLPEHVVASLQAGADVHLPKPIRADVLIGAIDEALFGTPDAALAID